MGRLLVVTDVLPAADSSAGEQRLIRLCLLLRDHFEVTVVAISPPSPQRSTRARRLRGLGLVVPQGVVPSPWQLVVAARRYDAVLIEFWHVAAEALPTLRRWQPGAPSVVDTVDLEFVRDARGTGFSHGRAADTIAGRRERELLTYRQADGLVFVSSVEQARYRAHSERPERTWVVPILVELHTRCARPRSPVVVFVGNFWHAPNVDGIVWFAGEIWPLIRTAAPGATLRIVGSHVWDAVTTLAALDGVEVVGFAEDLDAVYDEAAVVIAPLRYGAGMKGKICEALAAAVPVVTTEIGIEGLDVRPGVDLLVADGPEAMAAAVAQLLGDPARAATVGAAGQRAIARQCLPQTMGPIVGDLAEFLRAPAGRRRPWWRLGAAAAEVRDATARATSQARRTLAGRGKGR